MALTQMQLIQSLGEAMTWLERELTWGVPPTELRHLCGRVGELYAALMTNGQMAPDVNQRGYDVVSAAGERISVKTTAMMGTAGHIRFNLGTLESVDRVMVLRVNTEEMQVEILLDADVPTTRQLFRYHEQLDGQSWADVSLSKLVRTPQPRTDVPVAAEVGYREYTIRELESGTIELVQCGEAVVPVKPILRELAKELNVPLVNDNGNPFNTRQLGTLVMRSISAQDGIKQ